VIERGEVWWADLAEARGSEPGFRRPVVVIQADAFNRSRIETVVCVALTSNLRLADAPGNIVVSRGESGLPRDSVVNVSQILTVDRAHLAERTGKLPPRVRERIDRGLRLALGL
jgi:mRNA interferase MazF